MGEGVREAFLDLIRPRDKGNDSISIIGRKSWWEVILKGLHTF